MDVNKDSRVKDLRTKDLSSRIKSRTVDLAGIYYATNTNNFRDYL